MRPETAQWTAPAPLLPGEVLPGVPSEIFHTERKPRSHQRSPWQKTITGEDRIVEIMRLGGASSLESWWRNVHDGQLRVLIAKEPLGLHLSISHAKRVRGGAMEPGRYPTWDEIADARYELLPADLDFVMHLPPPSEYVAVHDTTFHLHQHPELVAP